MNSIPLNSILSSTYFGPVQWYQKLAHSDTVYLEQHDHFIKQTYRNRCIIATTQGPQALTVPVESPQGLRIDKTEMKDVRISDHGSWRHLHWQALQSAYGESPFFEFYADDLHPFFEKHWDYLFDFNLAIMQKMCELLDIEPHIELTEEYMQPDGMVDYRDAIRPKHPLPDASFTPRPYYQVYQQKFGFLPNLSILDLLFNEGNEAVLYL
ncbi:MAG: WbqC family protein [Prevotella sp.]|jgi:hypothetical protein